MSGCISHGAGVLVSHGDFPTKVNLPYIEIAEKICNPLHIIKCVDGYSYWIGALFSPLDFTHEKKPPFYRASTSWTCKACYNHLSPPYFASTVKDIYGCLKNCMSKKCYQFLYRYMKLHNVSWTHSV